MKRHGQDDLVFGPIVLEARCLNKFLKDENGATAIEYGLLLRLSWWRCHIAAFLRLSPVALNSFSLCFSQRWGVREVTYAVRATRWCLSLSL